MSPLTILFCDLDGFKQVNDHFGHAVGDQLLQGVAASIRKEIRPNDHAARMGGDEFCIASREFRSPHEAEQFAIRVRTAIVSTTTPGEAVGVSIGVICTTGSETPSELLVKADWAMYEAKRCGRNLIHVSASGFLTAP